MKIRALMSAVAMLLCAPAHSASPNMQPGLWEITMKTEMPGMPMQMPPQTVRQCFRKDDLQDTRKAVPVDKTCTMDEFRESGNTVRWKANCRMEGATMVGIGEVTFAGNGYSGTVSLSGRMDGQKIEMTQKYSARRTGDCK